MRYLKVAVVAMVGFTPVAHAGGLAEPIAETPVAPPPPVETPQIGVNGGYLLLGAFALMAAASAL
ncbi:hypothetical protein [Yoonia sp. SS1-5]|uniref:Ferrochelatase n=1 Tax=Yoonia rhodophyticola TaxID=3137370 RepID=A0AAN0NM00_9RHOB